MAEPTLVRMSYLSFLVIFLAVPILVLAWRQPRPLAGIGGPRARAALPLTCAIAFVYTTPWDNYLVYRDVWGYGPDRVLGTIGYVPYEEYAFFLLQPILGGLFLYRLLARSPLPPSQTPSRRAWGIGIGVYVALALLGAGLLLAGWSRGLYLGLILAWAGPVLLGMWIYAGRFVWRLRRIFLIGVAVPTLYLWIADALAIRMGIWYISDRYSLGIDPLGLPIEEATFFLVTNLLVVQGVLLFLFGDRIAEDWGLLTTTARTSTRTP